MNLFGSRLTGLWRHADFMRLWVGQTISSFGSMMTRDALPLTAIIVLRATPVQMGLFVAAASLPALIFGLVAGVWVDRLRRRPIMIITDFGQAFLLGTIPVAALLGRLTIEHLYIVVFLTGILSVFFDVAYQSYLPSLVQREHLVEGNSKLGMTSSTAEVAMPTIVGTLVQIITAPLLILIDAVSFIFSAIFLGAIRTPEPHPAPAEERQQIWRDAAEGFRTIWRDPLLRPLVRASVMLHFSYGIIGPVIGLFVLNELGLSPALWGLVISIGGACSVLGAFLAGPASRRIGPGLSIIFSLGLAGATTLLIPLAAGPLAIVFGFLAAAQIGDAVLTIYNINERSLRQTVTPDHLLGRVGATLHFLSAGVAIAGALIGGVLGEIFGLRTTIAVGATVTILAALWMYFTPVRSRREMSNQETGSAGS